MIINTKQSSFMSLFIGLIKISFYININIYYDIKSQISSVLF